MRKGSGIGVQEVAKSRNISWLRSLTKQHHTGNLAKDRGCSFSATARAHNVTVFPLPAFQSSLLGNQPVGTLRSQCSPQVTTPVVIPGVCGDPRDLR